MNVLRTIRKFRKMTLAEIRHRAGQSRLFRVERKTYRRRRFEAYKPTTGSIPVAVLGARAADMVPGLRAGDVAALRSSYPETHQRLYQQAQNRAKAVLSGTHLLLEQPVDLSDKVDWHADPVTGHQWKRDFYADVPIHGLPDGVDVKHVWEVNRHQYLAELGRAWRLTGDERYAVRVRELLLDWIDENPLHEGVNWTSGLELAVRSISWFWSLAALADWPGWRDEDARKITQSLIEHAETLRRHLSFYSSPYNHLIGEATALFLLGRWLQTSEKGDGSLFPERPGGCYAEKTPVPFFDAADEWEHEGRTVLAEFGPKQFYEDGFCVEQATGYHFFTLGFLVQAVAAARSAGESLSELEPIVAKAFSAGAALMQPDGRWPVVGDADSARSTPCYPNDFWDFRSLCSLGAVLCNLPELKATAPQPGEELYWLLSVDGLRAWDALPDGDGPGGVVLPQSGYAAARSGGDDEADWLLFDAGPLAAGLHGDATPSVAHGHADALQLLLFQKGRAVLVDSGMPSYAAEENWLDHFRGPGAHNTLEVDDAPWARPAGRLAWSHVRANPQLHANLSDEVWMVRGELALDKGVTIQRNVLALPGVGVWIADLVRRAAHGRVRWYWQMPGDVDPFMIQRENGHCEIAFHGGVLAVWTDAGAVEVKIETPKVDKPIAWHAPRYGAKQRGARVSCFADADGDLMTATFIGSKIVPFTVAVRGRSLSCGQRGGDETAPDLDLPDVDVAWFVGTGEELRVFAAGGFAPPATPGVTPLHGEGNWPAFRYDGVPATVHG